MRKITRLAVEALLNGVTYKSSNTHVNQEGEQALYLHGNKIAKIEDDIIYITTAGCNTNTTKERLRGIPGVSLATVKGSLILNGKEWDGSWTTI